MTHMTAPPDNSGFPTIPDIDTAALFFDIDGTLLDIADDPAAVEVSSALLEDLAALSRKTDGALALVTGRDLDFISQAFTDFRRAAAALHGAVLEIDGAVRTTAVADEHLAAARAFLSQAVEKADGLLLEDKGSALALHYRARPDLAPAAEATMERALRLAGAGWRVQPGKMVFELCSAAANKGAALRAIMEEDAFAGKTPIAFGDDLTDIPMLQAAIALGGVGVAVGDAIAGHGFERLENPARLRLWLHALNEEGN